MAFIIPDFAILSAPTPFAFINIIYNATGNYSATNVLVSILIITLTASCIAEIATASRQLWSFARDKGVPYSNFIVKVGDGGMAYKQLLIRI
jgi:amino acid transporter